MRYLLDTSILCRLVRPDDPQHNEARKAVELLLVQHSRLFITPQVEREFWVVATRPGEQNGLGLRPDEAQEEMKAFERICSFLPDSPKVHENWRQLVVEHGVCGKEAHDAGHVAAMCSHKIENILTFDSADFRRYDKLLRAWIPGPLLAEAAAKDDGT